MTLWEFVLGTFWFMLLLAWIWLLISIVSDIFRDYEMAGWSKALWVLLIIVVPWLGALVYLVARGRSMNERALAQAQRHDDALRRYVATAVGSPPSTADELAKLAELHDRGTLSDQEFVPAKAALLGSRAPVTRASSSDEVPPVG